MVVKQNIICTGCHKELIIDTYPVINLQENHEMLNDVFSLELFKIECPKCKKVTLIQYDTIIVDMYKKYIVYLCHNNKMLDKQLLKDTVDKIPEFNTCSKDLKNTRVVNSVNQLLEKLLIFDYDLNDKIIETLKYLVFSSNVEAFKDYTEIRFEKLDQTSLIFGCFNLENSTVQPKNIAIDIANYNNIIDSFDKSLLENTIEFEEINDLWVKQYIFKN
jgi:hypothetical protein